MALRIASTRTNESVFSRKSIVNALYSRYFSILGLSTWWVTKIKVCSLIYQSAYESRHSTMARSKHHGQIEDWRLQKWGFQINVASLGSTFRCPPRVRPDKHPYSHLEVSALPSSIARCETLFVLSDPARGNLWGLILDLPSHPQCKLLILPPTLAPLVHPVFCNRTPSPSFTQLPTSSIHLLLLASCPSPILPLSLFVMPFN